MLFFCLCLKSKQQTPNFKLDTISLHQAFLSLFSFFLLIFFFNWQAIKNSDLEEIRELGVGTYGTVFYGKWKGSDVAIKRLKRSCFAGGELGEERMVIIQSQPSSLTAKRTKRTLKLPNLSCSV